jgi:hypothetical protein
MVPAIELFIELLWVFGKLRCRKRACTQALFLSKAELGFFHFLEIVTGWLVPSIGQKIPVQPSWYFPPQKILHSGSRFLQAGKGAENAKEKSWQCFTNNNKLPRQSISLNCDINFTSFPMRKVSKP